MLLDSRVQLLKAYIKEIIDEKQNKKKLRVFDFDDTIVSTSSMIRVTTATGQTFSLTPGEYAVYSKRPGDKFDYSDFEQLVNPVEIEWTGRIIRKLYTKYGSSGFVILTARTRAEPVEEFLRDANMLGIEIIALGDSDPTKKSGWIKQKIENGGYDYVEFFDDSHKNIRAVRKLAKQFPDVTFKIRHVVHKRSPKGDLKLSLSSKH